ncbi:hypothetical protein Tco_0946169 [Tanacetum coccineum]
MVVPALEVAVPPQVPLAHHQIPTGISMDQNQNIPTCRFAIDQHHENEKMSYQDFGCDVWGSPEEAEGSDFTMCDDTFMMKCVRWGPLLTLKCPVNSPRHSLDP